MADVQTLQQWIRLKFADLISDCTIAHDRVLVEVMPAHLHRLCLALRDDVDLCFDMLMDVAGVDYLDYGVAEWKTEEATATGFSRGVNEKNEKIGQNTPRFATVYQLLSLEKNHRVQLKAYLSEENLSVDSVTDVWPSANWFEREAFDLFGIIFNNHPDCRRILTDYGFVGHPFRKDFPMSGHVEVRYDAALQRVIYAPVDIVPRILEPKVIRYTKDAA